MNNAADGARHVSDEVRHMQSGNLRSYAGWIAAGSAVVIAYMIWMGVRRMSTDSWSPYILTFVTFAPLAGARCCWCCFRGAIATSAFSRWWFRCSLFFFRCICRCTSIAASQDFSTKSTSQWISTPNIHYHMGMDGISMWLVVLTTFLTPLCVLISWKSMHDRVKEFFILLLIMETALIGVFTSLDLFLFYFFWEATLIPMALLIGVFGHERKVYAAVKFFMYTMIASVFHAGGDSVALRAHRQL